MLSDATLTKRRPRTAQIRASKIIEVDGVFIGAAVMLPSDKGWRFVAAHARAEAADGATAATLHDTQMLARRAFVTFGVGRKEGLLF